MKQIAAQSLTPGKRSRLMFFFLLTITVSYWYCLPVITQSIVGYNEFRGYDILLLILGGVLIANYRTELWDFFKQDNPGRALLYFCIWATATYPFTIIWSMLAGRSEWVLVTLIFLYHMWGFLLAYAAIRMFVKTRSECLLLLDVFLVIGGIEALIIGLQGVHVIPRFWSELYDVYGDVASGTLGPNRALPGHAMFLVFVVASSYWRNAPIVGIKRVIVAAVVALLAVSASVITGSRTTWSVLVVFCAISFIGRGFNIGIIALGLILAFSFVVFVPDSFKGRLIQTFENRVSNRLENAESESAVDKFQTMDAGRYKNWVGTYRTLVYVPWVIPFGGGFNSFRYVISPYGLISDTSAHNIYLTLICEVGVVGLFLYLLWFKRIWQETTALNATCAKLKGRAKVFLPFEIKPLLIAMLVSLSAGEILYPVRPAFAFMGMFLFVCAILNHKAFVTGIEASELNKQLIVQRLVTRLVYVRKLHKIRASLSASNS